MTPPLTPFEIRTKARSFVASVISEAGVGVLTAMFVEPHHLSGWERDASLALGLIEQLRDSPDWLAHVLTRYRIVMRWTSQRGGEAMDDVRRGAALEALAALEAVVRNVLVQLAQPVSLAKGSLQ
jgi:hypothetical protein